jgi:hypothetical protein
MADAPEKKNNGIISALQEWFTSPDVKDPSGGMQDYKRHAEEAYNAGQQPMTLKEFQDKRAAEKK